MIISAMEKRKKRQQALSGGVAFYRHSQERPKCKGPILRKSLKEMRRRVMKISRLECSSRGKSKSKCPEQKMCSVYLKNSKKASGARV